MPRGFAVLNLQTLEALPCRRHGFETFWITERKLLVRADLHTALFTVTWKAIPKTLEREDAFH
jgi:hypothetical protein